MFLLIITLCLLWIAVVTIGLLVKALAWFVIAGIVLFVLTIAGAALHAAKG
jgi:hypothetical protein